MCRNCPTDSNVTIIEPIARPLPSGRDFSASLDRHTVTNAVVAAFSGDLSLGALTAFLVTLSGVSIFHIGAAFWGLIFSVGVSWLLEQAKLQEARIRSSRG